MTRPGAGEGGAGVWWVVGEAGHMSRANEPAYPVNTENVCNPGAYAAQPGLTIREHFAAMAMQGFAACPSLTGSTESIVKAAVKWADALLAELAKERT